MAFADTFVRFLAGDPNKKILAHFYDYVSAINALEDRYAALSDDELACMTTKFKAKIANGNTSERNWEEIEKHLETILPEAFAVVREAGKRVLSQRPYDVQLLGAAALHQGKIAEMKTGEGKTLTSTMAVYLNALAGAGVHVVTVNDYLARRDASWMGQIFNFLGMKVACIQAQNVAFEYDSTAEEDLKPEGDEERAFKVDGAHLKQCSRKSAYIADITYGTNSEFGFDYLRDNMAVSLEDVSQRALNFAIIDEVDSILIDEARTPLIISSPDTSSSEYYKRFAALVPTLRESEDYNVDEKRHAVTLTDQGIKKMETLLGVDNMYTEDVTLAHHIEQSLKAFALYKRDKDYTVKEGEIVIVDEFTGRLMHGRRYSQGLHQAIEAKEGVEVQQESRTLATITIQNYFRMYRKLAGMTGTAATEAEEFHKIYNLDVVEVPTNRPMIRKDSSDVIYKTEKAKLQAVVDDVKEMQRSGQPVLVGTISIAKNEQLAEILEKNGVSFELLNAKHHEREAEIIAQAGRIGAVTLATNMAGRGVDIILGGAPLQKELYEEVKALGGLAVIGTERHESRRIDNQLRGRSGRQGDPGFSRFYISLEDELMRVFGSDRLKNMMDRMGLPDDTPITNKLISRSIESAQKKVEGHNFDLRKHLVEYDDVINKQREVMYKKRVEILRSLEGAGTEGENARSEVARMIEEEITFSVALNTPDEDDETWNIKGIKDHIGALFNISEHELGFIDDLTAVERAKRREFLMEKLNQRIHADYAAITKLLGGKERFANIERMMLLRVFDMLWMDHIDTLDNIRTGIGLQGYGQRDPLVEYKRSSFRAYDSLREEIREKALTAIFKIADSMKAVASSESSENENPIIAKAKSSLRQREISYSAAEKGGEERALQSVPHVHTFPRSALGKKIGRNDPCHCGSGKKFKKCCGR
ncbi:MAG: Protein translocase subunit SecA [Parcubacteria group bacterium GW2011_GWA2_44_12]|nr:MAG: Protein translocase subunit SecA [Parcubacteria group bacterium GW2011_GWA2_44_12]